MKNKIFFAIAFAFVISCYYSCTKDKVVEEVFECGEPITYVGHIKTITDSRCSYSGCHDGTSAPGGDYSTFTALNTAITSGLFVTRVIDGYLIPGAGMPDPNSVPPEALITEEELMLIQCWRDNDFVEE